MISLRFGRFVYTGTALILFTALLTLGCIDITGVEEGPVRDEYDAERVGDEINNAVQEDVMNQLSGGSWEGQVVYGYEGTATVSGSSSKGEDSDATGDWVSSSYSSDITVVFDNYRTSADGILIDGTVTLYESSYSSTTIYSYYSSYTLRVQGEGVEIEFTMGEEEDEEYKIVDTIDFYVGDKNDSTWSTTGWVENSEGEKLSW